VKDVEKTYNTW